MTEWAPFVTRYDGPPNKQGGYAGVPDSVVKRGMVYHSAVGPWSAMKQVLDDPNNAKSWQWSVLKNGQIMQHYPLSANCYHAGDSDMDGGVRANIDLAGGEFEGGAIGNESEPLNVPQIEALLRITRWGAEQVGLTKFARYPVQDGVWVLAEHNQVGDRATACPSNRINWPVVMNALQAQAMPPSSVEQLDALTATQRQVVDFLLAKPLVALTIRQAATLRWLEANALK